MIETITASILYMNDASILGSTRRLDVPHAFVLKDGRTIVACPESGDRLRAELCCNDDKLATIQFAV